MLLFALFFAVSLALQFHSGAWRSDFGGHADEAAHVVTALMVRDYLAGGFLEDPNPMRYAKGYYERFPKVALGHYPPGFYLVAGIALLPARSGSTFLVLMCLLSAGTGLLVFWFGRRILGNMMPAAIVALLYEVLPQTRTYTAIVMADLLLVFFGLLAARSFVCFLESERRRDSLLFGLWAAAAILTKGSGIGLALLPPVALVISSRWRWFFRGPLWFAPLPVIVLTLPWMFLTVGITSEGMQQIGLFEWLNGAFPYYARAAVREIGWAGLGLFGTALAIGVSRGWRCGKTMGNEEAALWALIVGGLAVAFLVPVGLDSRYLMPVVPAILLLGAGCLRWITDGRSGVIANAVVPLGFLLIGWETFRPVWKLHTGAEGPRRVLVVSDARGEGALIAAAALAAPRGLVVERGTKLLSASDWVGRGYQIAFRTREELLDLLASDDIGHLVLDSPPSDTPLEHWTKIHDWLRGAASPPFQRVTDVPSWRRESEHRLVIFRIGESAAIPDVEGR